jgi:hypothetical protein
LSRGPELFHVRHLEIPRGKNRLCCFPTKAVSQLISRFRLGQRLLRNLFYNVLPFGKGDLLLTFARDMALYRAGEFVHISGLQRRFRVLRGSIAIDSLGNAYFGEYLQNVERDEINIYCLPAGSSRAEVVHTFPRGAVRHVHGVFFDSRTNRLWCTTGDRAKENRILVTQDRFTTISEVGAGDESWRCVALSFGEDAVFYGTDAEFQPNHIYSLDKVTGFRHVVGPSDGPIYYTARRGSTHFFATAAEGCPSQPTNAASIWQCDDHKAPRRIATYAKDVWPNLFMHGSIHFALGPDNLGVEFPVFAYLHGLEASDERTIMIHGATGPTTTGPTIYRS